MKWLAKNISYNEMILSQTAARQGINNTPTDETKANLAKTALALQVIRSYYRKPMVISSGYRSKKLNEAVGGSERSAHMRGWAADFIIPDVPIEHIIKTIPHLIEFDQVINEFDRWVHLSIAPQLRNQVFKIG